MVFKSKKHVLHAQIYKLTDWLTNTDLTCRTQSGSQARCESCLSSFQAVDDDSVCPKCLGSRHAKDPGRNAPRSRLAYRTTTSCSICWTTTQPTDIWNMTISLGCATILLPVVKIFWNHESFHKVITKVQQHLFPWMTDLDLGHPTPAGVLNDWLRCRSSHTCWSTEWLT